MSPPADIATIPALRQHTAGLINQMDDLLAQGALAHARLDALYERGQITPGAGRRALQSDRMPPNERLIFRRLFDELEHLDERIAAMLANPRQTTPPSAAVRAAGSRFRI